MKTKGLLLILLALVLVALGFFVIHKRTGVPTQTNMVATTTPEENRTFAWRFETTESEDGVLPPRTHVVLITGGGAYDIGNYAGSCAEIAPENLLESEVSGVLCWFAGGGDEIGVFKGGAHYSVMQGTQEEGTAETPGFRGDFKEILVLE